MKITKYIPILGPVAPGSLSHSQRAEQRHSARATSALRRAHRRHVATGPKSPTNAKSS